MATEVETDQECVTFGYSLRTTLEVVLAGLIYPASSALVFAVVKPLNLLGHQGIDLGWIAAPLGLISLAIGVGVPFCYGYLRQRRLGLWSVWIGCIISTALQGWLSQRLFPVPVARRHHVIGLAEVTMALAAFALFAVIPTLLIMWGQSLRVRKQSLDSQR